MADRRKPRGKGEPAPPRRRRRPAAEEPARGRGTKTPSRTGRAVRASGRGAASLAAYLARVGVSLLILGVVVWIVAWGLTNTTTGRLVADVGARILDAVRGALGAAW